MGGKDFDYPWDWGTGGEITWELLYRELVESNFEGRNENGAITLSMLRREGWAKGGRIPGEILNFDFSVKLDLIEFPIFEGSKEFWLKNNRIEEFSVIWDYGKGGRKNDCGFFNLNLEGFDSSWNESNTVIRKSIASCNWFTSQTEIIHLEVQCNNPNNRGTFEQVCQVFEEVSGFCRKNAIKWESVHWNYYAIQRVNDPHIQY